MLCQFQVCSKVIQLFIYIYIFFRFFSITGYLLFTSSVMSDSL